MAASASLFPLPPPLNDITVLAELVPTGAAPSRHKLLARTVFTVLLVYVMSLITVLTAAFEVLRAIYRQVVKVSALTTAHLALNLAVLCFQEIVVLVVVVTKALSRGSHHFTLKLVGVHPGAVTPVS
jgi:hypothetical protein